MARFTRNGLWKFQAKIIKRFLKDQKYPTRTIENLEKEGKEYQSNS
jgi:hypothetical protein